VVRRVERKKRSDKSKSGRDEAREPTRLSLKSILLDGCLALRMGRKKVLSVRCTTWGIISTTEAEVGSKAPIKTQVTKVEKNWKEVREGKNLNMQP